MIANCQITWRGSMEVSWNEGTPKSSKLDLFGHGNLWWLGDRSGLHSFHCSHLEIRVLGGAGPRKWHTTHIQLGYRAIYSLYIYIIVYIYNLYISLGYSIVIVIHHLPGMYIHPSCVKSSGSDRTNTNSGSGTRTCTGGTWDGRWILLISMDWFKGQSTGKPMKTPYLLRKSMVSCKISLRSIQGWLKSIYPIIYDYLCL